MADDPLTDDVLDGVRAAREAFAARHGYDVHAIGAALRAMAADGDWPVAGRLPVTPNPALTVRPVGAAEHVPEAAHATMSLPS